MAANHAWLLFMCLALAIAPQAAIGARVIPERSREGVLIGYTEKARSAGDAAAGKQLLAALCCTCMVMEAWRYVHLRSVGTAVCRCKRGWRPWASVQCSI